MSRSSEVELRRMWMVRAGRGGDQANRFQEKGVVALGFLPGALKAGLSRQEVVTRVAAEYGDRSDSQRATIAGQVNRFVNEIRTGDDVVTYDPETRSYLVGAVRSGYEHDPKAIERMPHVHRVNWTHRVARDDLSTSARNTLGAIQSLFEINEDVAAELRAKQRPIDAPLAGAAPGPATDSAAADTGLTEDDIGEEMLEKADRFIEDRIARLTWKQMQELVAGLLRAMGYRTKVSAPGPDRGVDVQASPDGLGLQDPCIFVEVKHRQAQMGAGDIRRFTGGRQERDRCLFVSTGGFTKDAHLEAERGKVRVTLITLPDLRALLVDHYESLDGEARALVPLKRLYWPTKT